MDLFGLFVAALRISEVKVDQNHQHSVSCRFPWRIGIDKPRFMIQIVQLVLDTTEITDRWVKCRRGTGDEMRFELLVPCERPRRVIDVVPNPGTSSPVIPEC